MRKLESLLALLEFKVSRRKAVELAPSRAYALSPLQDSVGLLFNVPYIHAAPKISINRSTGVPKSQVLPD